MRKVLLPTLILALFAGFAPAAGGAEERPPLPVFAPPGQIKLVTINARQNKVLDYYGFTRLYGLARALRQRPAAFDGGEANAGMAPDIVVTQEMRPANLDILRRLPKEQMKNRYQIVGLNDASAQFLVDVDRLVPRRVTSWVDPCRPWAKPYQSASFTDAATGATFTVIGVHIQKSYAQTGGKNCYGLNIDMLRSLIPPTGIVFVAGDFNRRPVVDTLKCDPTESSEPAP
jgi:hypothetical protein